MATPIILASLELEAGFDQSFERHILKEISMKIKRKSETIAEDIRKNLKRVVKDRLVASEAYRSLLGGSLQGHLGVPDSAYRADAIIDVWLDGISVITKVGSSRAALLEIEIGVIQADYSDVLSMTEAEFSYYSDRFEGMVTIPWLSWLLLEGDRKIIKEFQFMRPGGRNVGQSRTGLGLMREGKGFAWQVPSQFSGTAERNFATEALTTLDEDISEIVSASLERYL